jgi:hypothetical protein
MNGKGSLPRKLPMELRLKIFRTFRQQGFRNRIRRFEATFQKAREWCSAQNEGNYTVLRGRYRSGRPSFVTRAGMQHVHHVYNRCICTTVMIYWHRSQEGGWTYEERVHEPPGNSGCWECAGNKSLLLAATHVCFHLGVLAGVVQNIIRKRM